MWEYFIPLMSDTFIMEEVMIPFFFDLIIIQKYKYFDVIVKSMEIHFSFEQLCEWTGSFMKILCRKITELTIGRVDKMQLKDLDMNYFKIIEELIKRDSYLQAWLNSENFFEDLENLYFIHMPTKQEWDSILQCIYHPVYQRTYPNRQVYEERMKLIAKNIENSHCHLFPITKTLL